MSFSPNLPAAARRHLHAADALFDTTPHKAVAGYLYGIAAECAVKALLDQAGQRPLAPSERRDDPLYAQFPELRTLVRDFSQGRLCKTVRFDDSLPMLCDLIEETLGADTLRQGTVLRDVAGSGWLIGGWSVRIGCGRRPGLHRRRPGSSSRA